MATRLVLDLQPQQSDLYSSVSLEAVNDFMQRRFRATCA